MTCVVVNDASGLIDLRKGRLLHAMLSLPYHFIIPYPVRASELLDFTPQEWQLLDGGGVETYDLTPDAVAEAYRIKAAHAQLSANDCFCLVATMRYDPAILMTGDGLLRRVAEQRELEVHGVLWVVDCLAEAGAASAELLLSALTIWREDTSVFLPPGEIDGRIKRFR